MREKEPTKLTGQNQGATTANVGAGLVPAQTKNKSKNKGGTLKMAVTLMYTHTHTHTK